jgi:hypothetical protein
MTANSKLAFDSDESVDPAHFRCLFILDSMPVYSRFNAR